MLQYVIFSFQLLYLKTRKPHLSLDGQRLLKMSREKNFSQTLGIDLIQAAKDELEFLKLVDEFPNLCKGPVVKNAILLV